MTRRAYRRVAALLAALAVVVLGGACASETRGTLDAPIKHPSNNDAATIINFPDGFHNIAFKCHGPNGVYTHTRAAPPIIVPNDPNCAR